MKIKTLIRDFLYAVIAGLCIGVGGMIFLSLKDSFAGGNVVGALLFATGLFVICTRQYNLFTGKVCYALENPPSYIVKLLTIWIGNFVGCALCGALVNITRLNIGQVASSVVNGKMADSYLSLFVLGIFCNILIFVAVDGYKKMGQTIGGFLSIFLGVSVFILIGSEHCVADMFYWCVSNAVYQEPLESVLRILIITAGNVVGGLLVPVVEKIGLKLNK